MNSALLSVLDTEKTTEAVKVTRPSTLVEVATIAAMFLATSAVVILLALTWVA